MNKNVNLYDISDGKFYEIDQMVNADTGGCINCSACCYGVGDLVILTPYDVYEMSRCLNLSFDELLIDKIELQVDEKIALPHLGEISESEKCSFLSDEGRCEIHAHRPSICRLFPLGRVYEDETFKFFLQTKACVMPSLEPILVADWIGIANYDENKRFLLAWHSLLKALKFRVKFIREDQELVEINNFLIDTFFRMRNGNSTDFYETFFALLPEAKKKLGII